jgi:glutathione S-transferase
MVDNGPLVLWVKAGVDGASLGGDPVCHQLFMMLLLKNEQGKCRFDVKTLNEAKPPDAIRQAGLRHAPALQHGDEVALQLFDEIVEYIDGIYPEPSLKFTQPGANNAVADLFRVFCFFIKEVNKDSSHLLSELYRLDQYLQAHDHRYLCGEEPGHLDCEILPKLHSIRIAAKALKEFEIPIDLHALWKYLATAYANDAFTKSCPSDQEIILYWSDRKDTPNHISLQRRSQLSRQKPIYTWTVPKASNGNE